MSEVRRRVFITCQELATRLNTVKVLDTSWLPSFAPDYRDFRADFTQSLRIKSAQFFDIDEIKDTSSSLPHMLPPVPFFEEKMGQLGINEKDNLCLYDNTGVFMCSARVWWMLRTFQHAGHVSILTGGVAQWQALDLPVETGPCSTPAAAAYNAGFAPESVWSLGQMKSEVERGAGTVQVVDARSVERWAGAVPEPRPMRGGRIPGSRCVPFPSVVRDNEFLPDSELRDLFAQARVDINKPLVATCGSGASAPVVALAAHLLNPSRPIAVYDGSWTEWATQPDTIVDTASEDEMRQLGLK